MIKAVIIEDERLAGTRLEGLVSKYNSDIQIIAHLPSIEASVKWFNENQQPDLIFMDIHLEDGLSFSIFDSTDITAPVIFTTAFDEYTIKAFKVNSIDYLLKPINFDDLSQSLDKFYRLRTQFSTASLDIKSIFDSIIQKEEQYKSRFLVSEGNSYISISIEDVAYFFAEDKFTFLISNEGKHYLVDYTLDKLKNILNPKHFYRINRQFIIASKSISLMTKFSSNKLKLTLKPEIEKEVFVSMDKYSDFKKWLDS